MTKNWTEVLHDAINSTRERKPLTLAEKARAEDFAERLAAAIAENDAKSKRDFATISSYLATQNGDADLEALSALLKIGPSTRMH